MVYELDSLYIERILTQWFLLLQVLCKQQPNNTRNHVNYNELKRGKLHMNDEMQLQAVTSAPKKRGDSTLRLLASV